MQTRWAKGNGGEHIEVLTSSLPCQTIAALHMQNEPAAPAGDPARWEEFLRKAQSIRAEAERRLEIVQRYCGKLDAGVSKSAALREIEQETGTKRQTLRRWLALLDGLAKSDWLPALAPSYSGSGNHAEYDEAAWVNFYSDYLLPAKPSAEATYERTQRAAEDHGWRVPSLDTFMRRLKRDFTPAAIVLAREGAEAHDRMYPPQQRDRSMLRAGQAFNADGYIHNVFVKWPDGHVGRPINVSIQDLYSNKIVAWRIDKTENRDVVRLAIGDAISACGIPEFFTCDNGRAFASKSLTGGMKTRFRFKVKVEDPKGILTLLGINIHWTIPGHGQSKPLERAHRDYEDRIDRHPAFAGAYCGNNPQAKPEDYGSRVVPLTEFLSVVATEIAAHNARRERRTAVCSGQLSFDEAFERSYSQSTPRKLTAAQRGYFLLAMEGVTANRESGMIRLHDNRYWCQELTAYRGQKLTVRFDPQNLTTPIIVETLDGTLIGEAALKGPVGFYDTEQSREYARAKSAVRKHSRLQLQARMTAAELAAMQPAAAPAPVPETKVVKAFVPKRAPKRPDNTDPMQDAFARGVGKLGRREWRNVI